MHTTMKSAFFSLVLMTVLSCTQAGPISQSQADNAKPCEQMRAEMDALLKPHESHCQKNEDCVCFDAGLSNNHPCGGVTNTQQFEQTKILRQQFAIQNCGNTVECVSWECKPSCEKGLCQTNGKY